MIVWYRICRFSMVAITVMIATAAPVWDRSGAAGAPDMELGRYLATECMTCHQSGTATSSVPNIFGLTETRVTEVMKAYRDKTRPNPVMQSVASRLTDEEIAALAYYFSKSKKP